MIFQSVACDSLCPSVLLRYHAIGLSDRVKSRTQTESPCRIPLLTLMGPTVSLPLLVVTSKLMFHVLIADLIRWMRFASMLCISRVS